jgi:hypothetical protein
LDDAVRIDLSKDEAIVLFEFLSRFSNGSGLDIVDQSEERVLWNILCDLERLLVEPFSPDYSKILDQARGRTRDAV